MFVKERHSCNDEEIMWTLDLESCMQIKLGRFILLPSVLHGVFVYCLLSSLRRHHGCRWRVAKFRSLLRLHIEFSCSFGIDDNGSYILALQKLCGVSVPFNLFIAKITELRQ